MNGKLYFLSLSPNDRRRFESLIDLRSDEHLLRLTWKTMFRRRLRLRTIITKRNLSLPWPLTFRSGLETNNRLMTRREENVIVALSFRWICWGIEESCYSQDWSKSIFREEIVTLEYFQGLKGWILSLIIGFRYFKSDTSLIIWLETSLFPWSVENDLF